MTMGGFGGGDVIGRAVLKLVGDRTQLKKDLGNAKQDAQRFQATMQKAAIGAGIFTAGAVGLTKLGENFAKADRIIRAGTGAQGEALEDLEKDFREVYKQVPTDAGRAAQAIADLNTGLGLSGGLLQETAKMALEQSRIMGVDAAGYIASLTQAMNAFEAPATKAPELMDKFLVISQQTGIGLGELTSMVANHSATFQAMGYNIEETAMIMGQGHKAGIRMRQMLSGLNIMVGKAAQDGEDAGASFHNLVTNMLRAETQGGATQMALGLVGSDGANVMAEAARLGIFDIANMDKSLEDVEGTTKDLAEETVTATEKIDLLKQKLEVSLGPVSEFAEEIGHIVVPLSAIATTVFIGAAALPALAALAGPLGLLALALLLLSAYVVVAILKWDELVPAVEEALLGVDEPMNKLGTDWKAVREVVEGDWKIPDVSSFIDRVLFGTDSSTLHLREDWNKGKEVLESDWDIFDVASGVDKALLGLEGVHQEGEPTWITNLLDGLKTEWEKVTTWWDEIVFPWEGEDGFPKPNIEFKSAFETAWTAVTDWWDVTVFPWLQNMWGGTKEWAGAAWEGIKEAWNFGWNEVVKWWDVTVFPWLQNMWGGTKEWAGAAWEGIKAAWNFGWNEVVKWWDVTVFPWLQNMWGGTKEWAGAAWEGIKEAWNFGWGEVTKWWDVTVFPWLQNMWHGRGR